MRFVTLFPQGTNIHLLKDVGQIPFTLKKEFGIDAALVSNDICIDDANIVDVPGLEIDSVHPRWCGWKVGSFMYLLQNAKRIDWLNVYHVGKRSYYWSRFYKWINHRGKVYLKLDMGLQNCNVLDASTKARSMFYKCLSKADFVSVESVTVLERIQKYTEKKIILIPNGYMLGNDLRKKVKKENVFLTVGRLGTREKATEVLLEAFAISRRKHEWKLRLVGPVEEAFKPYIGHYFKKYPELTGRVEFVGIINDRNVLAEEYRKAKIFVLPSRWEAFALVLPEAASQGCKMIVTSSVACCKDFVCNPEFGEIVPPDDARCLGEVMECMANSYEDAGIADKIAAYAEERFLWKNICGEIFRHL